MRIPGIPYHQGRNNYSDRDGMHYGIAIHNTSNTASDEGEASYADHRTDGTSSHFYVDRDSVIQSLDTNAKAGHAGSGNGNENAIAFEITGTNDKSRDWWLSNVAWPQLGYVIAYIVRNDPDFAGFQVRRAGVAEMKANPKVKAIYGHDDMRRAWGGTTHTDPGPNFPWDRLFAAVNEALGAGSSTEGDDDMAGEIADKALAQLDGGNALGEVYLRLLRGAGASGQPSGDGAGEANLERIVELLGELKTALGKLAGPSVGGASLEDVEAAAERAVRRVLGAVDGSSPTA